MGVQDRALKLYPVEVYAKTVAHNLLQLAFCERSDLEPTNKAQYLRMLTDTIRERIFPADSQTLNPRKLDPSW